MKECRKCGQMAYECECKLPDVPLSLGECWESIGSPIFWIAADLALLYGLVKFVVWAAHS
jgi:hypothetical protein